ncbi:MAG: hypothetical protein KO316_00265 [Methanobacterium sp.]|nr:hypothetical protein [Methanobacterium sp.]
MGVFGKKYLTLVLEINKHFEGYVDSYFGPSSIKEKVESSKKKPIPDLKNDVNELINSIPENGKRGRYLEKNLQSIDFTLKMLDGEKFDFYDEIEGLFNIRPRIMDENEILKIREKLKELLPSTKDNNADLYMLYMDWTGKFRLSKKELIKAFGLTLKEVKKRSQEIFKLVEGESVEINYVSNQPWKAYNYFLGNAHSKIDVNIDYPYYAFEIPRIIAHETYPGHHLLLQLREKILYKEKGYLDAAVCTLQSPLNVIAEGSANLAAEIIFPDDELYQWMGKFLLPKLNMPLSKPDELETFYQVLKTVDELQIPGLSFNIVTNTAIKYYNGELNKGEAVDYLQEYGLVSRATASSTMEMIMMPLFRSYMTIYSEGYILVKDYVTKGNCEEQFKNLLTENILPSGL